MNQPLPLTALAAFTVPSKVTVPLLGGAKGHDLELAEGIRTTLERIKATVEAGAPAAH